MEILSDKIVTTKKKHRCDACNRVFEAATKMRTQVNVNESLQTWRACTTCDLLLRKYRSKFEDDSDGICYSGCVSEILDEGQTPEDLLISLDNE